MLRNILPRVYELKDFNHDSPPAYFLEFEDSILNDPDGWLKLRIWFKRELEFQRLDKNSWEFLKEEADVPLEKPDHEGRGWQELITILNQARGYIYLVGIGCSDVKFIPRQNEKTPDVQGKFRDGSIALCEVKTLNRSKEEVKRSIEGTAVDLKNYLEPGFFTKLQSDINEAKVQLKSYNSDPNVRRIVYIVPNFDDLFAEHKAEYYKQIDQYMGNHPEPGFEIVFHNEQGIFFNWIVMKNADVVNETA